MRSACLLVLVPVAAFAGPKVTTTLAVNVEGTANPTLTTSFTDATRGKLDACWRKAGRAKAKVTVDAGKVTSVQIVEGDRRAAPCITKVLRAVTLADAASFVATIEVDAEAVVQPKVARMAESNRKVLDVIIDRNLSTQLSKFDDTTVGMGAGTGTRTATGPGAGTGTSRGVGAGVAEGDFVPVKGSKGTTDTGASAPASPKVVIGAIETGDMPPDTIGRVIRSRAGVFRACYQKELARDPKLAGKVVVQFEIAPEGKVTKAAVQSSTLASKPVEDCVVSNVLRLRFPTMDAKAVVTFPFVFSH